jgi:hypothetical protein
MRAVKREWASSWWPSLRRGAGHSRLTAGHRCPTCTTPVGAIELAGKPGEEVSSPGPPPRPLAQRGPDISRRYCGSRNCHSCLLPFDVLVPPSPQGGGHPAPDAALTPENRHTREAPPPPGEPGRKGSKTDRPASAARWRRGSHSAGGMGHLPDHPATPCDRRIVTRRGQAGNARRRARTA